MSVPQTYRVYRLHKRNGELEFAGIAHRALSPERAAVARAIQPGEYLVFDLSYTEVTKVAVTFDGKVIS